MQHSSLTAVPITLQIEISIALPMELTIFGIVLQAVFEAVFKIWLSVSVLNTALFHGFGS